MRDSVLLDGLMRAQSSYGVYGTAFLEELVAVRRLLIAEVQKTRRLEEELATLREALRHHESLEVLRDRGEDRNP